MASEDVTASGGLITVSHTYAAALAARKYADGRLSTLAQAVSDALVEQNEVKADRPSVFTASLPAADWSTGSGVAAYPYFCDLSCAGVTETDVAEVVLSPASQEVAAACGLCPTVETMTDRIRFYAKSATAGDLNAQIRIWKG